MSETSVNPRTVAQNCVLDHCRSLDTHLRIRPNKGPRANKSGAGMKYRTLAHPIGDHILIDIRLTWIDYTHPSVDQRLHLRADLPRPHGTPYTTVWASGS